MSRKECEVPWLNGRRLTTNHDEQEGLYVSTLPQASSPESLTSITLDGCRSLKPRTWPTIDMTIRIQRSSSSCRLQGTPSLVGVMFKVLQEREVYLGEEGRDLRQTFLADWYSNGPR